MSEQYPENEPDVPGLEAILRQAQGITADLDQGIDTLAALHWRWYQAWQEKGFPEERAADFTRILVAAGAGAIRSLD